MITRDTHVSIEFTCLPVTPGYSTGDHVCTWRFSGSSETQTGTTVSHTWTTGGIQRATVTAVNSLTGTSAVASLQLLIVKQPTIADPGYFLIDKPAAALVRTAIYYLDGASIHLWNPDTATDAVFCAMPSGSEIGTYETTPVFQGFEVTSTYLHAHYLTSVSGVQGAPPDPATSSRLISLRRRLDLSDNWTIYGDIYLLDGFTYHWNVMGNIGYLSFASGKTWVIGEVIYTDPGTSYFLKSYNKITGETNFNDKEYSPNNGIYYASFDRTRLGNILWSNDTHSYMIDETRADNVSTSHGHRVKFNRLGSIDWMYYQIGTTLHVCYCPVPGTFADIELIDHAMSAVFSPIPFSEKSLLVMDKDTASGANALWWTGAEFVEEFLGDADRSSLVPRLHSAGLVFARTGKMFSLADGSLLHCLV